MSARDSAARLALDMPATAADVAGELRRAMRALSRASVDGQGRITQPVGDGLRDIVDNDDLQLAVDRVAAIADGLHPGGAR